MSFFNYFLTSCKEACLFWYKLSRWYVLKRKSKKCPVKRYLDGYDYFYYYVTKVYILHNISKWSDGENLYLLTNRLKTIPIPFRVVVVSPFIILSSLEYV